MNDIFDDASIDIDSYLVGHDLDDYDLYGEKPIIDDNEESDSNDIKFE